MKKISLNLELIFNLLFPLFISFVISMTLPSFKLYFLSLTTLFYIPPIIFPLVWTILYFLIGYIGYVLSKASDRKGERLYYISLLFNFLWTPAFFGLKSINLGLIIMIALIISQIILTIYLFKYYKKAYYLSIPYLLWLFFALFLNASIAILN